VLIGNKSDMADQRKVSEKEAKSYCASKNMIYVECSAKDDDHIKDIFVEVARALMKREDLKNIASQSKKGKGLSTETQGQKKKEGCC
jgi:GTPase SAR1 family protein